MFVIFGGGRFGLRGKIFTSLIGNESSSLPIQEKCTPVLLVILPHFISDHQVCGVFFHTSSNSLGGCVCLCVCAWVHMLGHSVEPDSLWSQGLQPTRLLCPWGFPGKNTGVSCHCLFQGIFLTQELNPHLLHCRRILYCRDTREAGVLEFNSILTLTTWSWYQISQVNVQSPLQIRVASLRLSPALLTYQL